MSDVYEKYQLRRRKHNKEKHELGKGVQSGEDPSCKECYPLRNINQEFINFWDWYKKETLAKECTEKTFKFFILFCCSFSFFYKQNPNILHS